MAGGRNGLRPQDVVVLLRLVLARRNEWVIAEIAHGACVSVSETHAAIQRLESCRLFDPATRRPIMAAVEEFLLVALKYLFPAEASGKQARGMPTAHSAPPLCDRIVTDPHSVYVWPCPFGQSRGISITPLYKTVPEAAQRDADMYEFLALADAICIGRVRERELASELLVARLRKSEG